MVILLTIIGFFLGALPFSVWIGQRATGQDIRDYGDHNPGATNVLRAGGYAPFVVSLLLDISKGALPVGFAYSILGIQDWGIVPIALAPPIGHAFSPFLNWKGGKAIATTFGVWIGLTIWVVPLVSMILLTIWSLIVRPSGWAVMLTMLGVFIFMMLWNPLPTFIAVLIGQTVLLTMKHKHDLRQKPELRLGRGLGVES